MAHFAELNKTNTVLQVIVVGNDMILDEQGQESEALGIAFCKSLFAADTRWVQTSYNANMRKNYAGIGYIYDQTRNAFIAPQPVGNGWIFDEITCQWKNPEMEAALAATKVGVTRV